MRKLLGDARISFFVKTGFFYLMLQLLLRCVLFAFSAKNVSWSVADLVRTFCFGMGYDTLVFLYLLLPVSFIFLFADRWLNGGWLHSIMKGMLYFWSLYTAFVLVSEFYFWEEFQTRYNFIAVDYLIYTQELFGNIFESYNLFILVVLIGILTAAIVYVVKYMLPEDFGNTSFGQRFVVWCFYVLFLTGGTFVFSSNLASFVSNNVYNQEISRNGIYQFVYAFFNNELDYNRFYCHRDETNVVAALRAKMALDGGNFVNRKDLTRNIVNHNEVSGETPNICVIVVESLSSRYTGMDGNKNSLTPKLDRIAKESFAYTNVYATGTRTVRGLEALTLSLPPTPGQSIIRRPDCAGFHTVGTELRGHGYATEFVYGGYGYFDNMNTFFEGNRFEIFDRNVIPSEKIYSDTVWGVADEILFDHVIERLDDRYNRKEPVFQIVLTTTNHRPFIFPEGRVDAPQGVRDSVVLYTDWAIDNFIEKSRQKPWFDNTVFVIVADHNALAAGSVELPVNKYKIPCLVYAPRLIKPGRNNRLMSQIDVIPTVMGMLGFSYQSKNLGYDINKLEKGAERAFISTYQQMGFIKGDRLVVLTPGNRTKVYRIDNFLLSNYTELPIDETLVDEAVTWYQGANIMYKSVLARE